MKTKLLSIILIALVSSWFSPLAAQDNDVLIQTEETDSIDFLLNTVFRKDTCFELTPGTISGARRPASGNFAGQFHGQTGIFRNGMASVGIDSGIIVTSGSVIDAGRPNNPNRAAGQLYDFLLSYQEYTPEPLWDEDIVNLLDSSDFERFPIYDPVVLDFDFIPTTDTISFNYVFFSEEYCFSLGADFGDRFGFILTRPDGSKSNIARLPVSNNIVSVSTLNPFTADSSFFINNTDSSFDDPCPGPPASSEMLASIAYNGFSQVLTARGAVTPCAPHNLKIIVYDVDSPILDSGVMLEAGSFLAGLVNKPEPTTTSEIPQLTPVESCDSALIRFTRRTLTPEALAEPLFVKYSVIPLDPAGPLNEAVRATDPNNTTGADYILPESPFVIPPGDTSGVLSIPILGDAITEGVEAFVIRYDGTCDCTENADTFYIQDNVDFDLELGDDRSACADTDLTLTAVPLGGNGTYTYQWPDGSTTQSVVYTATGRDTTITVTATDGCGLMGTDDIFIAAPTVNGSVGGNFSLCALSDVADVMVDVEGSNLYTIVLEVDSNGVTTMTEYTVTDDTTFRFTTAADVRLLSVADASGCGGSATGTARVRTGEVALSPVVSPAKCGDASGSISLITDDGNADFTFDWVNPAGASGADLTGLTPGVYEVDITRNGSGCPPDRQSFTVMDTEADITVNANVTDVRCRGNAEGTIVLTNNAFVPLTYSWEDGSPDGAVRSGLTAGTYRLTISETNNPACTRDTAFTVDEPDAFVLSLSSQNSITCPGETLTITPTLVGGTPPFTFDWDNGAAVDSLFSPTLPPGSSFYPLVVTDDCGQILRDTLMVMTNDARASISGTFSVCNTPTASVPLSFTGRGPFTYVIEENGVARTQVLRLTNDTALVYDAATTLNLLSVTDGDGCPGTVDNAVATVTDASFSVVASIEDVLCNGDSTGSISLIVNSDNSAYDFEWTNAPTLTGPVVGNLPAGTYDLTVRDRSPDLCRWDTTFMISEPASALALLRDSTRAETCRELAYAEVEFTGGTGQLEYVWNTGTTGPSLGEVPAGDYQLTVTDQNGCTLVQPYSLADERTTVTALITQSAVEISCTTPNITLTAAENNQPVTYVWRDAEGNQVGTGRTLDVTRRGTYSVLIENTENGCSASTSVDIDASDDLVTLNLPAEAIIDCNNTSVDFAATTTFTGALDYEWRLNDNVVGTGPGLSGVTQTGAYRLRATRQDNGCVSFATINVRIERTPPVVTVTEPTVTFNCRTPEVLLSAVPQGNYLLAWTSPDGNIVGSSDGATVTADQPGFYLVTATDTTNGCTATATVQVVNDDETLTADAGPNQTLLCDERGNELRVRITPDLSGTAYRWTAPNGREIGTDARAFSTTAGDHIVEVIHPLSGCSSFDTVRLVSEGPTDVSYSLQQPPCPEVGGRLFVTGVTGRNGPFTFSSPTGRPDLDGNGLRNLSEGSNVLVVTDVLGCTLRDTFLIFEGIGFNGTAPDVEIRLGEEATLGITVNRTEGQLASYTWSNLNDTLACGDCPDPTVRPLESFVAQVMVMDSNGCSLTLRQNVIVEEPQLLYLPNAFSPNGDGINDVYRVFGSEEFVIGINWLRLFDRWGNLVYEASNFPLDDPLSQWDGTFPDGQLAAPGIYAVSVSYNRYDGKPEVVTGEVTLLR